MTVWVATAAFYEDWYVLGVYWKASKAQEACYRMEHPRGGKSRLVWEDVNEEKGDQFEAKGSTYEYTVRAWEVE